MHVCISSVYINVCPPRFSPLWEDLIPDPRGHLLRQKQVTAEREAVAGSCCFWATNHREVATDGEKMGLQMTSNGC